VPGSIGRRTPSAALATRASAAFTRAIDDAQKELAALGPRIRRHGLVRDAIVELLRRPEFADLARFAKGRRNSPG
jgi:hypothetical protein